MKNTWKIHKTVSEYAEHLVCDGWIDFKATSWKEAQRMKADMVAELMALTGTTMTTARGNIASAIARRMGKDREDYLYKNRG